MNAPAPRSGNPDGSAISSWLDFFRWVAALSVLITHASNRMLLKITELTPAERSLARYGYAFISGFAHQGVMVFFVISGFLVGGSLLQEYRLYGAADHARYLVKRLTRLWTVIIPALLLGALLDTAGATLFNGLAAGIYQAADRPTLLDFAGNVVFLQCILVKSLGTNGALWSLASEFWYYMLFPLALLVARGGSSVKRGVALGWFVVICAAISAFDFCDYPIVVYFSIWLIGVFAAAVDSRRFVLPQWLSLLIFLAYILGVRLLVRGDVLSGNGVLCFVNDAVTALLFAQFLISVRLSEKGFYPPLAALNKELAAFSFSLYCTHVPLLMVYCAVAQYMVGFGWKMRAPGVAGWMLLLGALGVCLAGAYLFYLLFERQTGAVRRAVMHRLMPQPATGRG